MPFTRHPQWNGASERSEPTRRRDIGAHRGDPVDANAGHAVCFSLQRLSAEPSDVLADALSA